jgi:hypothetical protein
MQAIHNYKLEDEIVAVVIFGCEIFGQYKKFELIRGVLISCNCRCSVGSTNSVHQTLSCEVKLLSSYQALGRP